MKTMTNSLRAFFEDVRAGNQVMYFADCFKITLRTGDSIRTTNATYDVVLDGEVYSSKSVQVSGLLMRMQRGLSVDSQQVTLVCDEEYLYNERPLMRAISEGLLDGATVVRHRAFLRDPVTPPVGKLEMFSGFIGEVQSVGQITATISVNSVTSLFDVNIPRNKYTASCVHVLYGTGCRASRAAFSTENVLVEAGSSRRKIVWAGAGPSYQQGTILFTSGLNAGLMVTIARVEFTTMYLAAPLPQNVDTDDRYTISFGCDHTRATCVSRFNNEANFRGFPYVPPPTSSL